MKGQDLFSSLPEDCFSHIISFTSPRDACRSSAVCSIFQSALESNSVWECFLPPDYRDVLAGSVSPVRFSSKKELFFRLCDPVLIDDHQMSFSIEKRTGRKCYMLSARKLWITWRGDTPMRWMGTSLPESRFLEVAVLSHVRRLEINGKIDAHLLSPKTTYKAYLVIKFVEEAYGLDYRAETSVKLGDHASNNIAILQQNGTRGFHRWRSAESVSNRGDGQVPQARSDGWMWMEIELGEVFNDEGEEGNIEMSLKEVKGGQSRLFVQGIEMRPVCD